MIEKKRVVIFDRDELRRARVCRALLEGGFFAEPLHDPSEFPGKFQAAAIALLHDDGDQVEKFFSLLKARQDWVPLLAYDSSPSPAKVVRAIKAGAIEYLEWPFTPEIFSEKVALLDGELKKIYVTKKRENHAYQKWLLLSDREQEVIAAISKGYTTQEIADRLLISARTVEIHRTNAIKKIGARRTADAVRIMAGFWDNIDWKKTA